MTLPDPFVGPVDIRTTVSLPHDTPVDAVLAVLDKVLREHPGVAVTSWRIEHDGPETAGAISDLRAAVKGRSEPSTLVLTLVPRGLNWILIKRHDANPAPESEVSGPCLTVDCDCGLEPDEAEVRHALALQPAVLRALCTGLDVLEGWVFRNSSFYVPAAPQGWDAWPMCIVSRRAVAEAYADPGVYWQSWDHLEALDADRVLASRALDVADERAYKRAVYPRIWDLLYAARPGKSGRFHVADLWPEDEAHFEEGEPFLRQLGYSARDQSLEFTAVVPADAHLRPREIMVLARYHANGRLPIG